jgi:hypothetical protein
MKLNQNTIETLKNFAGINTNILIKQGDELSTISTMKNIFAKATITDKFTKEFGIYDLNQFLSLVTTVNKPELSFKDEYLEIFNEGSPKKNKKFHFAHASLLTTPTKEIKMPEADVTFTLLEADYKELLKDALILQAPDLALIGTKGGDVVLKVFDKKDPTSNSSVIPVGQNATADYTFYFKVENMKMLDGDYDVAVSSKSISHFKNKKLPVEYWIALESDSIITK